MTETSEPAGYERPALRYGKADVSTDLLLMNFVLVRTNTLETLPIGAEPVFVGSAEWKADLCLADDSIDEVHCELAADSHGIRVESLSPDGVQVNGQVIQSALLFANDRLAIGPFEFRIERAGADSSRPIRELPATLHAGITTVFETDDENLEQVQPETPEPAAITESRHEDTRTPGPDIDQHDARDRADDTSPIHAERGPATAERNPVDSERISPREPSEPQPAAVVEPQYFVQRQSSEEGPLPRRAVQDLISRGQLPADTPVRLEWNSRWSNAVDLGFAYPDQNHGSHHDDGASAELPQVSTGPTTASCHGAGVRWGLMAPFYYARTLAGSLQSLSLKQLALVLLVFGATGFAAQKWMNRYARTALTGTVLLDDQPLGDVVVTFTGMKSGEVAAGVADDAGQFRVLTISGKLSPGPYRITVQPEAGLGETVPNGDGRQIVPERYALLATSDVTVDVRAGQTDYAVPLSRFPRSSRQRARRQRVSNT